MRRRLPEMLPHAQVPLTVEFTVCPFTIFIKKIVHMNCVAEPKPILLNHVAPTLFYYLDRISLDNRLQKCQFSIVNLTA